MKVWKLLLAIKNSVFDDYFQGKVKQIKNPVANDCNLRQKNPVKVH